MSTKGKFSVSELLISIAILGMVVFFCYQMLMRQKRMVMKVNQNIEVTTVVHQIREMLSGVGCRENLSGFSRVTAAGKINEINQILTFLDGTSSITPVYTARNSKKADDRTENWSQTGLILDSFSLNPNGIDQINRPDRTYLLIHFLRKDFEEMMTREIRIFTKDTNGVITDCSLVPFIQTEDFWVQKGANLEFLGSSIGIGTQEFVSPLNIQGGLYSTESLTGCSQKSLGLMSYNKIKKTWNLCTQKGLVSLRDQGVMR